MTTTENKTADTPFNFDLLPLHMWNNNNPRLDPDSVEDMVRKYRDSLSEELNDDWETDYRAELQLYYGGRKVEGQPFIAGKLDYLKCVFM